MENNDIPISAVWFMIDFSTRAALVTAGHGEYHPGMPFENLSAHVRSRILEYLRTNRWPSAGEDDRGMGDG